MRLLHQLKLLVTVLMLFTTQRPFSHVYSSNSSWALSSCSGSSVWILDVYWMFAGHTIQTHVCWHSVFKPTWNPTADIRYELLALFYGDCYFNISFFLLEKKNIKPDSERVRFHHPVMCCGRQFLLNKFVTWQRHIKNCICNVNMYTASSKNSSRTLNWKFVGFSDVYHYNWKSAWQCFLFCFF